MSLVKHPLALLLLGAGVVAAYLSASVTAGRVSLLTTVAVMLAAAVVTALLAWLRPAWRSPLAPLLTATLLVFLAHRLAYPWQLWLRGLPLDPAARYWLVEGPGGGVLGLLPSALLTLAWGWWAFRLSLTEQWGGQLGPNWLAVVYGVGVGVGIALVTVGLALAVGAGQLAWAPNWAGHGVNAVSNWYEEVITRGMLLQVARRAWGSRVAVVWTGVVFGLTHGLTAQAAFIALTAWAIGWAVLQARTLWAGWVAHQVADLMIDSVLH